MSSEGTASVLMSRPMYWTLFSRQAAHSGLIFSEKFSMRVVTTEKETENLMTPTKLQPDVIGNDFERWTRCMKNGNTLRLMADL